jgi:hypothetical protein
MTTDSVPERLADQPGRPAGVKRTSDCSMLVTLDLGSLSNVQCNADAKGSALSNDSSDVNRAPELLYSLPDCMRSRYRCSEVFLG